MLLLIYFLWAKVLLSQDPTSCGMGACSSCSDSWCYAYSYGLSYVSASNSFTSTANALESVVIKQLFKGVSSVFTRMISSTSLNTDGPYTLSSYMNCPDGSVIGYRTNNGNEIYYPPANTPSYKSYWVITFSFYDLNNYNYLEVTIFCRSSNFLNYNK